MGKDPDYVKEISDKTLSEEDPDILVNQKEWQFKLRQLIDTCGIENVKQKLQNKINIMLMQS